MFCRSAAALFSLIFAPIAAHALERPDLAACDALFAASPDAEEPSSCFFQASKDPEVRPAAAARLESLLARHPGHPWLSLYLGHLKTADQEEAAALYRAAAAKFAALHEARGEVLARGNLQRVLTNLGKLEEAGAEAERAVEVAEASKDPELIARSKIVLARHLFFQGQDLERSYLLLRSAQEVAFPDGAYPLQRDSLIWLGNVSLEMGRFQEARGYFRREAELASANEDRYTEASARYGLARAFLDENAEMPREGYRAEAIRLAEEALAVAETNQGLQAKANWLLGLLLRGRESRAHLDQCLEAAADALRERSYCLNALARHLAATDPKGAREAVREALDLAQQADSPWAIAYSWREQMRVSWASGNTEQAVADSYAALDAIEALRDLQVGYGQAEMFATWSEDYSWFAGKLLQAGRLDGAFDVMERMRGRALLDALTAARVAPALTEAAKPLQARRAALLGEISRVQRRLLTPDLPAIQRQAARLELERLELEEAGLRNRLEQANPARWALRASSFSSLVQVRKALAPDEALLSFQIAPDEDLFGGFGGSSWLLAVTHQGSRVYPLERDRVALRPAIDLFTGLFGRRDGSEAGPAAGLYNLLLRDALRDLPQGVRRLVIIPDDALHQLPFSALRPAPEAAPLATRYRITIVPSATLWLRWRNDRPLPAPEPLLALADPILPGASGRWPVRPAAERAVMFADPIQLGPLPFARQEGKAAVRHLGGGSVLRVGEEASEGFLKTSPLSRFGVLHFATHAVLDDQNPERSGVLLTPAPASEDGLLQIREIVPLDLRGRVAVLSSCRSASGTVLRGEGVMGIARAFFQAGAHTVVASLWPLRDDDGAALFDRFYTHLGEGLSVAEALRAAQRDRIEDGAPAYAWAGLVVLGDGDLVPLPGGRRGPAFQPWLAVAAGGLLLLLLGAGALVWLRRERPLRQEA